MDGSLVDLIVIVTSEREHRERSLGAARLTEIMSPYLRDPGPVEPELFARRTRGLIPATGARELATRLTVTPAAERGSVCARWYEDMPSTPSVAADLVRTRARPAGPELLHLHSPNAAGGKSAQLDVALAEIADRFGPDPAELDRIYLVVIDADSKPDLRAVQHVARTCADLRRRGEPMPALFQQVPMPLQRPASARRGVMDRMLRTYGLWHVRRALAVETDRLLRYGRARRLRPGSLLRMTVQPLVYAVGCSMFLHVPALLAVGGFPDAVDDIGLGHRYTLRDHDLRPVPYFTTVDRYSSVSALTRAFSLVLWGSISLPPLVGVSRIPRYAQRVLLLREVLDTGWWVVGPPIVVASSAYLIARDSLIAVVLLAIAFAVHYPLALLMSAQIVRRIGPGGAQGLDPLEPADVALACLLSPVLVWLHWVGPAHGVHRIVTAKLAGRDPQFGKTER